MLLSKTAALGVVGDKSKLAAAFLPREPSEGDLSRPCVFLLALANVETEGGLPAVLRMPKGTSGTGGASS